jgi:hypothetical protein
MNPHGRLQDGTTALLLILLTVALSMGTARTANCAPQRQAPNILLILADDKY